jgi:hypothetical protein
VLVDVTGKIKFGTAGEAKRFGTGRNDYALHVDAVKSFAAMSALGTQF